jgi:hypothetical protein
LAIASFSFVDAIVVPVTSSRAESSVSLIIAGPDGNPAINLAAAKLRRIAGTRWSTKRYLNMKLLKQRNAMTA